MNLEMNSKPLNKEDKNIMSLIQLYYDDPILFSQQILHVYPDEQQIEVINGFYNRKRVTVRAGRGCGKTWVAGIIIWHFLCTRSNAQVYITAASGGTISGAIWPTLGKLYDNMESFYRDQFDFQTTRIKHIQHPHTWFAQSRTARIENPDALAGTHAINMLYVIDEASGVGDPMFMIIKGSLTQDNNYLAMFSNPRKLSGFFFESHDPKNSNIYSQHHMSCIISPWVLKGSIEEWKDLYGIDSNQYKIEVLGEFPDAEDNSIIPRNLVLAATKRKSDPAGDMRWGLDVGAGGDISVLIKRQGPLIFPDIKKYKFKDTMRLVGKVVREYNDTPDDLKPVGIYVDTIGVGKGPGDRLKEQGLPIVPAVASNRAYRRKYNYNAKSEWWKEMYEWFRDQDPSIPHDKELIQELTTCKEVPSSDGRFKVEPKDRYKSRLKRSPDTADALAITFSLKSRKVVGLTTG